MSSPIPVLVSGLTVNATVGTVTPDGTVTTRKLVDGAVTTAKVANGAITQAKLDSGVSFPPPDGSVTTAKLADANITESKLSATLNVPFQTYAKASLPSPDSKNRIARLSDYSRGPVYSNGSQWLSVFGLDVFVLEDFGGKGDAGITDNLPAWNAIMAAIQNATSGYGVQNSPNGAIIRFAGSGVNVYNFSDTPKLTVPGCIVEGSGGAYSGARTLLTVPSGKVGFIVGDVSQDGGNGSGAYIRNFGVSGNGYLLGGAGSNNNVNRWSATTHYNVGDIIQPVYTINNGTKWGGYLWKCTISGTSGSSEPTWPICNTLSTYTEDNPTQSDGGVTWRGVQAHGIVIHGSAHAENVTVSAFAGDGWHIYGDTDNSNTDLSTFVNCSASSNFGSGFWTAGPDAAPSVYQMCNAVANFGYGFYDFSAEGNIYINCHTRNDGVYIWIPNVTRSLNTPTGPTVPNGYEYMVTVSGASGSTEPVWPTTIGETVADGDATITCMRLYSGGPYYMRNSGLLACYSEGDQQPSVLSTVVAWSKGGAHGAGVAGGNGFLPDPSGIYGMVDTNRFNMMSLATVSDNGDSHPIKAWLGSPSSRKVGWSVAKLTNGSPASGTVLDLLYSTGNATTNGWRYQIDATSDNFNVCDGTESGTTAGDIQFPTGFWLGGPQSPASSSFVGIGARTTRPAGGRTGDVKFGVTGTQGIGSWHALAASADDGNVLRWAPGAEAGAFFPIDVSSSSVGSPYQSTRGDHNAVFYNDSASVKSSVNLRYCDEYPFARNKFICTNAAGLRINAIGGQDIRWGSLTAGVNGYLESTQPGATLTLESTPSHYNVVSAEGVWKINGATIPQPGVEALLATVVLDMSLSTKQNIYTVPAGFSCVPTKVVLHGATAAFAAGSVGFGFDAGAANVIPSAVHTELANSTTYTIMPAAAGAVRGAAADVFGAKTTVTQSSTSVTVDIFGYLL